MSDLSQEARALIDSVATLDDPGPADRARVKQRLTLVLGELCRAIQVDRAYVVLDEKPAKVLAWPTDRAAYSTVLFPIVALGVSTWLEDYRWTPLAGAGVALVLLGNVIVLLRRKIVVEEPLTT